MYCVSMSLNSSPVELTTAATDVVIALVCVGVVLELTRLRAHDSWKTRLGSWVFILLTVAYGLRLGLLLPGELERES